MAGEQDDEETDEFHRSYPLCACYLPQRYSPAPPRTPSSCHPHPGNLGGFTAQGRLHPAAPASKPLRVVSEEDYSFNCDANNGRCAANPANPACTGGSCLIPPEQRPFTDAEAQSAFDGFTV